MDAVKDDSLGKSKMIEALINPTQKFHNQEFQSSHSEEGNRVSLETVNLCPNERPGVEKNGSIGVHMEAADLRGGTKAKAHVCL